MSESENQKPLEDRESQQRWLIPNWLPAAEVGLLAGVSGCGKTRLALQIAYTLAAGEGWDLLGLPALETPELKTVVYAGYADPPDELIYQLAKHEEQLQSLAQELNRPRTPLLEPPQELHILDNLDLHQGGPMWGVDTISSPISDPGPLPTWWAVTDLASQVEADLLIIDPVEMAFAGDENNRAEVTRFMNELHVWSQDTDTTVLVVSRLRKYTPYNPRLTYWGPYTQENRFLFRWLMGAELKPPGAGRNWEPRQGRASLQCPKSDYGPQPDPISLIIDDGVWLGVHRI